MFGAGDSAFIVKLRGLPFSCTVDDVLKFLSNVNVVGGANGVHLTEIRPGRPSGEAFVEVESQEDVDLALAKDKQNMGKRYIEVFSTDRQDMEWAINATRQDNNGFDFPNVNDDVGVLKLRGLPYGCSKEEIVQFFNGFPVIEDGVTLLSDGSGRASGEAFVHFADRGSAQAAMARDREKIGHRYIELFQSSVDEVRAFSNRMDPGGYRSNNRFNRPTPYDRGDRFGGRFGRGGGGKGFGGGGGGFGPRGGMGGYGGGYGGGLDDGGPPYGLGQGGSCVHMRGLPFKATAQDIAYFFKPIRPLNVNILFDQSGRPSGEADVEFECHEDAVRAMRRDKNNMDNRYIELFLNSTIGGGPPSGGYNSNNRFRNNY